MIWHRALPGQRDAGPNMPLLQRGVGVIPHLAFSYEGIASLARGRAVRRFPLVKGVRGILPLEGYFTLKNERGQQGELTTDKHRYTQPGNARGKLASGVATSSFVKVESTTLSYRSMLFSHQPPLSLAS